jgi:hypothetical protein
MNLRSRVNEILSRLSPYLGEEEYNNKLLDIYSGQLLSYVEEELAKEIRDPDAFRIASQRIPPINFCKRIVDKLAKTYIDGAERETTDERDEELLEYYEEMFKCNVVFARADKLLELHKYVALEPFWHNNQPKLRLIPADRFKVFSDDAVDPMNPTIFVKYVGSYNDTTDMVDSNGVSLDKGQEIYYQYYIYTAEEFVIVDVKWQDQQTYKYSVNDNEMLKYGITNDTNPYGVIPFVYVRRPDIDRLIPNPDTDMYRMTTLIPRIIADLNYAAQFNSHSRFVAIDLDPESIKGNPDSLWTLRSVEGEGKVPSITTLSPTVDIAGVSQLIELEVGLWLQSKGIRPGASGKPYDSQSISGVARMIEEMDATQYRKELIDLWTAVEYEFWALVKHMHNVDWSSREGGAPLSFSESFVENLTVTFPTPQPSLSEEDTLKNIKIKMDLGLISKQRALSEIYPSWTSDQIQEEIALIGGMTNGSEQQFSSNAQEDSTDIGTGSEEEDA